MLPIEEYLERRGAKYFVTVLMLFYVLGTVIFNIYLRSIGLYEFDLLQLRYMFIGFTFGIITIVVPGGLLIVKRMIWGRGEDWTKKEKKERERIQDRIEKIVLFLFIPWVLVYALYIFPSISPGFGGGSPVEARLIGEDSRIKRINAIIARETGVDVTTLPYESLDEDSDLAVGANVQILDQSKDRYLLLLTKDLYLSSQSQVAKKLIEEGSSQSIDIEQTKNFKNKPLPISANGIETITLSLYEPPELLTKTDLEVAAATLAASADSEKVVSDILQEVEPDKAEEIFVAVKKTGQEIRKATPPVKNTTFALSNTPDPEAVTLELQSRYDTTWLDVRAELFGETSRLQGIERSGIHKEERGLLVERIQKILQEKFVNEYKDLDISESGYLSVGSLYDSAFATVLTGALRGSENVEDFIKRVNALSYEAPVRKPFDTLRADIIGFFDVSVLEQDTQTNRNYISEKILQYLQKEAPEQEAFWKDTQYLRKGKTQEGFSIKLKSVFESATTWEQLGTALSSLYEAFLNPVEKSIEEETKTDSSVETTSSTTESTPPTEEVVVPKEDSSGSIETRDTESSQGESPVVEDSASKSPTEETPIVEDTSTSTSSE